MQAGLKRSAPHPSASLRPPTPTPLHRPDLSPAQLDWEKRVASIEAVPALVADLAAANLLDELLPKFGAPLTAQLSDLRSATVRAVCAVLAALIAHLGSGLAPLVPGVLPQLLRNHLRVRVRV